MSIIKSTAHVDVLKSIHGILSEPIPSARLREEQTFVDQLSKTDGSAVIFGAGRLGRVCAEALGRAKIRLCAFCDNALELVGGDLEGVPVLVPEVACRNFGKKSLFIVAIWPGNASESLADRVEHLTRRGCVHVVSYAGLLWAHGHDNLPFHSLDLPSQLLAHAGDLKHIADRLADEISKETFYNELRRRLTGQIISSFPAPDQYFPSGVLKLSSQETVADIGAYTGDTLTDFASRTESQFTAYYAFEPDLDNVVKLRQSIGRLPKGARDRVQVHCVALSDRSGQMAFSAGRGNISRLSSDGETKVPTISLDALDPVTAFTIVKIDVEGGELACLAGAMTSLRRRQPTVVVCAYHRPEDLWTLPGFLIATLPSSRFYYRMHGHDGWESVFYAVGPNH